MVMVNHKKSIGRGKEAPKSGIKRGFEDILEVYVTEWTSRLEGAIKSEDLSPIGKNYEHCFIDDTVDHALGNEEGGHVLACKTCS
ncbi:putative Isocitrate dehydrogenase [NADP] [Cocos nucifera]|uniref:Putative Isocitrate dehydrogenase [NADP] n=1 Tax=Cocos nucifera TaxID=13894 RepID=A0A8K0I439_COCNU|nr:putative Isocitrate dehydrogenase [NADP] [Cocos nucifera]